MSKKRVLVCGATGFIGRNIAERFAASDAYEVVAIHNKRPAYDFPGIEWVQADLTQPGDVERCVQGIDIIVQAAATTSGSKDIVSRPYIHVTDNAVMNSLLFRAAHDHNVGHVIFFSCTVMYPSSDTALKETDFDANAPLHPRYFGVGWTKVYVEKMCEFYANLGRTKYTALRHSNIYGAYDKFDLERSHVFGATVTKTMTAADGRIVVWGEGTEGRDLLHADDLVDAVECAIRNQEPDYTLYNIGYGEAVTIRDLVAKIVAASGRDLAIEHDLSQPTIPTSLFVDCARARAEIGWERKIPLDEGIAQTIAWWRDNIDPESVVPAPANG